MGTEIQLANGVILTRESSAKGHAIRFKGKGVDVDMVEDVMREIERLLG